jgi:hypothetical protein
MPAEALKKEVMPSEPTVPRAHPRRPVRASALVLDHDHSEPRVSSVRNFSVGGIFVECTASISPGEELSLLISDEGGAKVLRVNAVVVRVEAGVGFGARFVARTERGQESIGRFAERLFEQAVTPPKA